jgi:hypothetical protein
MNLHSCYLIPHPLSSDLAANSREPNSRTVKCTRFRSRLKMSTWRSRRSLDTCAFKVRVFPFSRTDEDTANIIIRPDRRPSNPHNFLRRRNHRAQTPLQDYAPVLGFIGKSRLATLGTLPSMAPSGEIGQITLLHAEELSTARAYFHALERILPGARPSRQDDFWCELRGFLLHLLQPVRWQCQWHLLPCEEREVPAVGLEACA